MMGSPGVDAEIRRLERALRWEQARREDAETALARARRELSSTRAVFVLFLLLVLRIIIYG